MMEIITCEFVIKLVAYCTFICYYRNADRQIGLKGVDGGESKDTGFTAGSCMKTQQHNMEEIIKHEKTYSTTSNGFVTSSLWQ